MRLTLSDRCRPHRWHRSSLFRLRRPIASRAKAPLATRSNSRVVWSVGSARWPAVGRVLVSFRRSLVACSDRRLAQRKACGCGFVCSPSPTAWVLRAAESVFSPVFCGKSGGRREAMCVLSRHARWGAPISTPCKPCVRSGRPSSSRALAQEPLCPSRHVDRLR